MAADGGLHLRSIHRRATSERCETGLEIEAHFGFYQSSNVPRELGREQIPILTYRGTDFLPEDLRYTPLVLAALPGLRPVRRPQDHRPDAQPESTQHQPRHRSRRLAGRRLTLRRVAGHLDAIPGRSEDRGLCRSRDLRPLGQYADEHVRTVGYDRADNLRIAKELQQRIAAIPGVVDAHLQQEQYAPDFLVDIDRARALQFGIKASNIGNNISTTFSSSEQVQPNFWTDPKNGIPYYIAVQTPQYLISSMGDIGNTPVNTGTAPPTTQPVPGNAAESLLREDLECERDALAAADAQCDDAALESIAAHRVDQAFSSRLTAA